MRVLVTGGSGFIGSNLATRCVADGHQVRILAQENTRAETENRRRLEQLGVEFISASISDDEALARAVWGVDWVFHLAATQHEMNVPDERFHEVNVEGTKKLVEACCAAGVGRLVYGSTIGVYGILDGVIDEQSPCRPDNVYGRTKYEAERAVLQAADRLGVSAVRIPETYGPGDRRLLKLFRGVKKGVFFVIGDGENLHHLIYVDDLVEGLLKTAAADQARGEVLLLAGKEAVSTSQMIQLVVEELDVRPPRFRLPLFPFIAVATVAEGLLRPLGIQPPIHRRRLDFFRKSFTLSSVKASQKIGFEPSTGFALGVKQTAEWYRSAELL